MVRHHRPIGEPHAPYTQLVLADSMHKDHACSFSSLAFITISIRSFRDLFSSSNSSTRSTRRSTNRISLRFSRMYARPSSANVGFKPAMISPVLVPPLDHLVVGVFEVSDQRTLPRIK